ncbi:MAG: hypothetical protein HY010_05340 [Acidobacteria bacterium]|nr:hypothetical protein [Acidobacteriota bacterium]
MLSLRSRNGWYGGAIISLLLAGLLIAVGCGGGASSTTGGGGGGGGGTGTTAAQIKMGDAPADRVLVFEVTVGPIKLTPTTGAAVTVLSTTKRLELTHLSGTNEPLALLKVPQGSYASATLTVASPEVVFINNLGQIVKLQPAFNQPVTVNFSPAFTVGASAPVVNIDLNVTNSLTFDGQGNVTGVNISASSFNLTASTVAAQGEQEFENGELEDITGTVSSVTGTTFVLALGTTGTTLTFATDANTQFNDGATLATMANTVVTVEGVTRTDGSLYAKEVEGVEDIGGAEVEGLISQVTGAPATQLTFTADDGSGSGMDDTKTGSTFTADVTGAGYKVGKGNIDTSGIGGLPSPPNFPFDASTVHAGQRIEIESHNSISGDSLLAEKVTLQQQSLSGTVSGLSGTAPTTFTLTVAADSAFATFSGSTTATIYWQPGTDLHNLPHTLTNGDAVRVRGLLFFTGSKFNMIARRITP